MFSEFAYSSQMQLLLAAATFIITFCNLYLVSQLIPTFCDVRATIRQRALFAFITGTLLHNVWVYSVYLIGGMVSFTPLAFALVVSPNPVMAFLYYLAAVKIFKLPSIRSIKMMGYVYLYWTVNKSLYQLFGAYLFVQTGPRYNYLMDAVQVLFTFCIFCPATILLRHYVRRHRIKLMFMENGFFHPSKELRSFFIRITFIYIISVTTPLVIPAPAVSSAFYTAFLVMFICINIFVDLHNYDQQVVSSQQVHISALFKGLEEFRGIKHDFYNILHTYSGYLELGEYEKLKAYHASVVKTTSHAGTMLDLARRTPENPMLLSLLMDKLVVAENANVKMMISLKCDLKDFYINTIDFCRVLSCLLDNAVEAAAESVEKRIYFTCETTETHSKLVIITNTTASPVNIGAAQSHGASSKTGHSGIGLTTVRNTMNKYGNCTFRIQFFNEEFSAYIEFREP